MMTRERWTVLLAALVTLAVAYWLFTRTEWVERDMDTPPRGVAARDEWYAATALLGRLGVPVQRQDHLDSLPPPGTTLWLESTYWDLFPERSERLRRWVEQGGHLVVSSFQLQPGDELAKWVPMQVRYPTAGRGAPADADDDDDPDGMDDETGDDDADAPEAAGSDGTAAQPAASAPGSAGSAPVVAASPARALPSRMAIEACADLHEQPAPEGQDDQLLRVCGAMTPMVLASRETPSWALHNARGAYVMRVPVGAGHVTAMGTLPIAWRQVLEHDHAQVLVGLLGAQPGRPVWLVSDEARPPLLLTVWQRGAPAVLLAALALALALWRAGMRFGPAAAQPPAARRSVAEQVRGTAWFVWKHSPAALLAAQQRATVLAAQRHVPRFAQLDAGARAAALARLTGLPEAALAQALASVPRPDAPTRAPVRAHTLALLETARRRLTTMPAVPAAAGAAAVHGAPSGPPPGPRQKDNHGH